jgi:hypothetical protein
MVVLKFALGKTKSRPIFVDLLRLITNLVAALSAIHNNHGELTATRFFKKELMFVSKPEYLEEVYSL